MWEEAMLASKIRYQDQALLAKEYYFHNSNWMYKPLWTYEAEKRVQVYSFIFTQQIVKVSKYPAKPSPLIIMDSTL